MKTTHLAACLIAVAPMAVFADNAPVSLSAVAAFSAPETIAGNIKAECSLPEYQAQVMQRKLTEEGFEVSATADDAVPATGRFLQVRITGAISAGNAWWGGHHKQLATRAILFEDGKEVATKGFIRRSGGGALAGFKGSCAVLERCADTLAADMTRWLKSTLDARVAAATTDTATPADNPTGAESTQQQ